MAIFTCVGCFYFRIPEGICFAGFTCTWLHFARFHLCFHALFSSLNLLFLAQADKKTHQHEKGVFQQKKEIEV
jgi:hypothetical protein